ncbi:hypothetical protein [Aeromonas sp. R6-2]
MFISDLFTQAWFGGAFYEQPMHCFYTVVMVAQKEDIKRIRLAPEASW